MNYGILFKCLLKEPKYFKLFKVILFNDKKCLNEETFSWTFLEFQCNWNLSFAVLKKSLY